MATWMSRTRAGTLTLLTCLVLNATALADEPSPLPQGQVTYVGGGQVYLDRGRLEGLQPGMVLTLSRGGEPSAKVVVVSVGDHRASATVQEGSATPRALDVFALPGQAAPVEAEPTRKLAAPVPVGEGQLAATWQQALEGQVPTQVTYKPKNRPSRVSARLGTTLDARTNVFEVSTTRVEQQLLFRARGDDLGIPGLGFSVRGRVELRYDGGTDAWQSGSRAIPLIREVMLRYAPGKKGIFAAVGRLSPHAGFASIVDGAELALRTRHLTLSAYGGMKPALEDLALRMDHPTAGAAALIQGGKKVQFTVDAGAFVDADADGLYRRAASFNTRVVKHGSFSLTERATVDLLSADGNVAQLSGPHLSLLSLDLDSELSEKITLELSGRYHGQVLFREQAAALPPVWAARLADRTLARAEAGLRLDVSSKASLKPYLSWHQELLANESDELVLLGGLAFHRERLFGSRLGLDVSGEYGDGTRQQASLNLLFTNPGKDGRLYWSAGLFEFWTFGHETGVHDMWSGLSGRVTGAPRDNLQVFCELSLAAPVAIVASGFPYGGFVQSRAGLGYVF